MCQGGLRKQISLGQYLDRAVRAQESHVVRLECSTLNMFVQCPKTSLDNIQTPTSAGYKRNPSPRRNSWAIPIKELFKFIQTRYYISLPGSTCQPQKEKLDFLYENESQTF